MTKVNKYIIGAALSICCSYSVKAQVLGGTRAFEFLNLSTSPHLTALGGEVVANTDLDAGLAGSNPALYRPTLHNQLVVGYNAYHAGIGISNVQYVNHSQKLNTTFAYGVQNVNYGTFDGADIFGNATGDIKANDIAIKVSASKAYGPHWRYGATLKWAHSSLAGISGDAVLLDVGVVYVDTISKISFGAVAKNMGVVLNKYNNNNAAEPLPFDFQIGITKELANVPLKLFIVGHHLYKWDIRYNNPSDKKSNDLLGEEDKEDPNKKYFGNKLLRHINMGGELFLGKRVMITAAYSFLRRNELSTTELKGLSGFSMGAGIYLNKFQIHYGISNTATASAYNEFGLNFALDKIFKSTNPDKMEKWNNNYSGW